MPTETPTDMATAAVITGDIVNSTMLPHDQYEKILAAIGKIFADHTFEFYRGDSFQAYIKRPETALEIVFRLRAAARSINFIHDIRASIGIGKVSVPLRVMRTASDEAFVLSGRAFENLNAEQQLAIESPDPRANIAFRVIADYADFLCQKLTPKQAEVLTELLKEETQTDIAKKLKKAQATVNQHAQSASWPAFEKLIHEYQQAIIQFNLS
jgi:hypothetical protein